MRQHNQYLLKVQDELSVYQKYLLNDEVQLTDTQRENWDKLDDMRAWLKEGYSDMDILRRSKKIHHLQERRSRELLAMAYEIFAELRKSKNKDGVKYVFAEIHKQAAQSVKEDAEKIMEVVRQRIEDGDRLNVSEFNELVKSAASLLKIHKEYLVEAGKIEGAYETENVLDVEDKKKPQKITIKVRQSPEKREIEEVTYETA